LTPFIGFAHVFPALFLCYILLNFSNNYVVCPFRCPGPPSTFPILRIKRGRRYRIVEPPALEQRGEEDQDAQEEQDEEEEEGGAEDEEEEGEKEGEAEGAEDEEEEGDKEKEASGPFVLRLRKDRS
jgi:hypothetical protein